MYDATNGNRYGDGISASIYIQKVDGADLQINSAGYFNDKRVICTSTGMYDVELYVNKKMNSRSAQFNSKSNGVVSLNGSSGSTFGVIYNKDSNGILGIAKYSLNTGAEQQIDLSVKITANAYNDKGEVSAQMTSCFAVYPVFACYANKSNSQTLYC